MAKLKKIRAFQKSGNRPQDRYREWLEQCHHYKVCAYCLKSYDNVEIEHFVPEQFGRDSGGNPNKPKNLFLACHDCNYGKLDYHRKNVGRNRLRGAEYNFHVLNSFLHDFCDYFEIDDAGYFEATNEQNRNIRRADDNILLFGFDQRHDLADRRLDILRSANILEDILATGITDVI